MTDTRLLICGEQVGGEGPSLEVENPYSQETIATVALPSAEQVDAALGGELSHEWEAESKTRGFARPSNRREHVGVEGW